MILYIFSGFLMTIISLSIGILIGYSLGNKNEKTLKQQVSKLRQNLKRHNRSAQLKELTTAELRARDDWDFRNKLAEITGSDITTPDTTRDSDPNSMENTF